MCVPALTPSTERARPAAGNSANHDLCYGEEGDLTGADRESQEVSMLALHLLQSALVHVSTLLLRDILSEEK
ncbi:Tn3 family transposase [Streptomyces sp. NPDC058637]|uniref:Tn3 family transposase n=1 Tax=Streptomyces sp. NPDC058637 TaxID=3346569 RepID=UPI003669969C